MRDLNCRLPHLRVQRPGRIRMIECPGCGLAVTQPRGKAVARCFACGTKWEPEALPSARRISLGGGR
jgi:hypothetical protein